MEGLFQDPPALATGPGDVPAPSPVDAVAMKNSQAWPHFCFCLFRVIQCVAYKISAVQNKEHLSKFMDAVLQSSTRLTSLRKSIASKYEEKSTGPSEP